ncbi:DUF3304 domain-containing protein [Pseudomonas citronellolis]|uniref:DUF3304 domain-containing protein n=1 Tax=Pseudomonas citronellolis TaxID=53408 RepID=UPI0022BA167A|nr:DUF3304 domain-containing protein [Pseudomonas citronellolis]WBG63361.1 DUF3304 domain-containing protein [Pseudomonas citronellolis]
MLIAQLAFAMVFGRPAENRTMPSLRWLKPLVLVAALLATAACERAEPPTAPPADDGMTGLQVSVLNYTDEYIDEVYVNGSWAANAMAHSGGGKFSAHAAVPRQRDPNYTLTIQWRTESLYLKDPEAHYTREVATEPYQPDERGRLAMLWVAFFPNDVIKLYPAFAGPGAPDFADGLLEPKLQCRKEHPGSDYCEGPPQLWQKLRDGTADEQKEVTP